MIGKSTAILAAALLFAGCGERPESQSHDGLRIVSTAPNTAEILYALGLSNQVVGVSRYTSYPPDAAQKPSVGGTYDPNLEELVSLRPDLVVGLNSQKEIESKLTALGIRFLGVPHEHLDDIMQSILTIGKTCGAEAEAEKLFQTLEKKLSGFPGDWKNPKPRVLVCVGHDESFSRMYVAAKNTFYDELIEYAGGFNACEVTIPKYPEISPEGLAAMHPDFIIDILPAIGKNDSNGWKPYRSVAITNDYAFIPGPRFVLLLEDFSRLIHEYDSN